MGPGEGPILGLSRLLEELRHGEDQRGTGSRERRAGSLGTVEGLQEGTASSQLALGARPYVQTSREHARMQAGGSGAGVESG